MASCRPMSGSRCSKGSGCEGALPRVARAAYPPLGRRTFLRRATKESRAWTFRAGCKAPECAGVIHSDCSGVHPGRGHPVDELLELGSWNKQGRGKLRVRRKIEFDATSSRSASTCSAMPWLVRDGDVWRHWRLAENHRSRSGRLLGRDAVRGRASDPAGAGRCTPSGMRFPIDVAFCDRDLRVIDVLRR